MSYLFKTLDNYFTGKPPFSHWIIKVSYVVHHIYTKGFITKDAVKFSKTKHILTVMQLDGERRIKLSRNAAL